MHRNASLVALFVTALTAPSFAALWQWQHPNPTGATLNGIASADAGRRFWCVGDGGTILASSDSGRTWQSQTSPNTTRLYGVAAVSDQQVRAVGEGGTVLATDNGGVEWFEQATGVRVALRGIAMLDATHGWAVGDGGVILFTEDGGRRWTPQYHRDATVLHAVAAFDRDRLLAVGYREGSPHGEGVILVSGDGGVNWEEDRFGPAYRFTGLWVDRGGSRVFVVGAPMAPNMPPLIMESVDGGTHWREHRVGPSGELFGVHVVGEAIICVGRSESANAYFARSLNDGTAWDVELAPLPVGLRAVAGVNPRRLIAVGQGGTILGPTSLASRFPVRIRRSTIRALAFTNSRRGCAVGDDGLVLCTDDSGRTWNRPTRLLPANYRNIVWTSRDVAYAVAEAGIVMRTLDGGDTWGMRPTTTETDLNDIAAWRDFVWVVGSDGFVLRSEDRGNTWRAVEHPTRETLIGVAIDGDHVVGVLSASGAVWLTRDDGQRWTRRRTGYSGRAAGMAMPAGGTIIVAAAGDADEGRGILLRSDDAGESWRRQTVPLRPEAIAFRTPEHGIVVGEHMVALTRDGGATWQTVNLPTDAVLRDVAIRGDYAWCAGDFATVIRLTW